MPKRRVAPKAASVAPLASLPVLDVLQTLEQRILALEAALDTRVTKLEAATGVNPPATGETVERSMLARLDALERR